MTKLASGKRNIQTKCGATENFVGGRTYHRIWCTNTAARCNSRSARTVRSWLCRCTESCSRWIFQPIWRESQWWPKEQKFEISSNYQLSIGDENKPFKVKYGFKQLRSVSTVNSRTNWKMASDHGIFFKNNIPFIYFGVGEHRNYHTPNDNFEQANLSFFQRATEVIYHNLNVIDNAI